MCAALVLGELPPPRMGSCQSDEECAITTDAPCCSCCPGVPRAVSRSEPSPDCSNKNCGFVPCKTVLCKSPQDPSTLQAVCRAGTCRAEPVEVKNPSLCSSDADCVVLSSYLCCPLCCPPAPEAMTRAELQLKQERCETTVCTAMVRCAPENCPPPPAPSHAVCRSNHCALVPSAPDPVAPAAECRSDRDCTVSYPDPVDSSCSTSPCGCCPGQPQAVPVSKNLGKPVPKPPPPKKSPFGLSQPPGQAPNCAPCPRPLPGTAACQSGRCVLKEPRRGVRSNRGRPND